MHPASEIKLGHRQRSLVPCATQENDEKSKVGLHLKIEYHKLAYCNFVSRFRPMSGLIR